MSIGPYLFAWSDEGDSFDASHWRMDVDIFSFKIHHSEGEFAQLSLTIKNPRVGLLSAGRKVWGWFGFNQTWETPGFDVVPLFFGRLIGIPTDLDKELVTLEFVARPHDFQAQKVTVAETLKVRPYWDAIWFAPDTVHDPDNVLEARPELWHIDRVTLHVSSSNIIAGEDGTIALGEDDVIYDSVTVTYGQAPVRRIDVTGTVSWEQNAKGLLNISERFGTIRTFTGDGLVQNWPVTGTRIGAGWSVAAGACERLNGVAAAYWGPVDVFNRPPTGPFDLQPQGHVFANHALVVPDWQIDPEPLLAVALAMAAGTLEYPFWKLLVPLWLLAPTLVLQYEASRQKKEVVSFSLKADVQAIFTEPGDTEFLSIDLSSSEVATPDLDVSGAMPIGDVKNRSYFSTDRGAQSLEYLICVARARLLARARAVTIGFELPLKQAILLGLSCRKNVALSDGRLPGGLATGKILEYEMQSDGASGQSSCTISIGCTVGKGNTVVALDGTPTYVQVSYVDAYQRYDGQYVMPVPGEILYESLDGLPPNDDGVDFDRMTIDRCVSTLQITGYDFEQIGAMGTTALTPNDVYKRLNDTPTTYSLTMVPLTGGPFETLYAPVVSQLMVPKTINLEAV